MKLHGQCGRDTDDKISGKTWHWLRNGNLKQETESFNTNSENTNSEKFIMRMSQ